MNVPLGALETLASRSSMSVECPEVVEQKKHTGPAAWATSFTLVNAKIRKVYTAMTVIQKKYNGIVQNAARQIYMDSTVSRYSIRYQGESCAKLEALFVVCEASLSTRNKTVRASLP